MLATGAYAFLRSRGPRVVTFLQTQENVFELVHSRVGEQKRGIVRRDERGRVNLLMSVLDEMEQVVPWRELGALVEPHYPKPGNGRPPVGVERMLRIYFLQQWFNLSDPAVEEALYDSAVMRQFVGIDLGCEPVPDETTACKFRHLLEEHQLGEQILGTVNLHLQAKGVRITTGTIVDATILHAPTSTKNREQQRDPEMHQTKKGKQWYFGMKAHVGVDSKTKIIHTAVATAANVADSVVLPDLLHGEETRVWAIRHIAD